MTNASAVMERTAANEPQETCALKLTAPVMSARSVEPEDALRRTPSTRSTLGHLHHHRNPMEPRRRNRDRPQTRNVGAPEMSPSMITKRMISRAMDRHQRRRL